MTSNTSYSHGFRRPRRPDDRLQILHENWSTTTSGGSTFVPSGTEPASDTPTTPPASALTSNSIPLSSSTNTQPTSSSSPVESTGVFSLTTFTATVPVTTITDSSATFTSFSEYVVTASGSGSSTTSATSFVSSATSTNVVGTTASICIGDGMDAASSGLIASIVLPSAIGLVIWLLFAIIRPRFRQVYGLREWFLQQDLRPKPLGSSFFAFLFPHVPLVPSMPSDVSDAGRSLSTDSQLFPSDEQLSQRALWISFLVCLGWAILGLAGVLPLYMVSLPCIADQPPPITYGGGYSTLQDLSLSRLLRLLDSGNVSTTNLISLDGSMLLAKRADGDELDDQNVRTRIIVLTVLTLVLGLLPALWKILKEFNNLVAYRKRWIEVKCENQEMGWLSVKDAPGFVGWGEKKLKDFIVKAGLSSSLDTDASEGGHDRVRSRRRRKRTEDLPLTEQTNSDVDVLSVFSICDTHYLAMLIDERDEVLENLEIAETRYINSFRITTPDPSIASFEPRPSGDPNRPYISLPRPLRNSQRSRRRRQGNPAFAASSLAANSFVLPSQYYRLRGVHGLSGGHFASSGSLEKNVQQPSFSDSIHSRVVGSRFHEIHRDSQVYDPLNVGSTSELGRSEMASPPPIPNPRKHRPNHPANVSDDYGHDIIAQEDRHPLETLEEGDEEWIDVERTPDMHSDFNGPRPGSSTFRRPRPQKQPTSATKRETFPFRKNTSVDPDELPPPHLRLQQAQPFVRPNDGINYEDLGEVYSDITQWRSKLKNINAEIAEVQHTCYNDIADGARIKGWLMVGRGLRHISNVQLIEGRAKEDVRWDVLQDERTVLDTFVLWAVVAVVVILLAAGLTAATGLALAAAPEVAHYLPFLSPLSDNDGLPTGLAIILAPAVAASLFVFLALLVIRGAANVRGSISISGGQLLVFKVTFFILAVVASIWLTAIGGLLFAIHSFSTNSSKSSSVADGSIYISALALSVIIQLAIIIPGLLLLQPHRLWRVIRAERQAVTPRQKFRAIYPRTYDPSYATGACVLAIVFASIFTVIFPLIAPAVVILLFLTLLAHRFLVGYVYGRTHSQTGGVLQIWLLRRFGTLLSLQPILLGLIFLSRRIWIEGGVLVGTGVAVIIFVELYTSWKTRLPGKSSLSEITRDSLDTFEKTAKSKALPATEEESDSQGSSSQMLRTRGSIASVLDMMSQTLAVIPNSRGPVPLQTETLDDLIATERAARTHPDAPPRLPPLFGGHADDMSGILYAPELTAPPPTIWLPNDSAGVARSEAEDLQRYHDLSVTLNVQTKADLRPSPGKPRGL